MKKKQTPNPAEYIAVLAQRFRPATDERDTTHFFSTEEVCHAIQQLNPAAAISASGVYNAMQSAGFRFACRPGAIGLDFRWMLHEL